MKDESLDTCCAHPARPQPPRMDVYVSAVLGHPAATLLMYCLDCGSRLQLSHQDRCQCCGREFDGEDARTYAARLPGKFSRVWRWLRHSA